MRGYGKCVRQESCLTVTCTGHPESRFTFDLVADENVSQVMFWMLTAFSVASFSFMEFSWSCTQVNSFKVAGVPMVENCVRGYSCCMFAYGQVSLLPTLSEVLISLERLIESFCFEYQVLRRVGIWKQGCAKLKSLSSWFFIELRECCI